MIPIFSSGRGDWVVLFACASILGPTILARTIGLPWMACFAVFLLASGVLIRRLGRKFNQPSEADIQEALEDGRTTVWIRKHSLFWIAMEHWAIPFFVVGALASYFALMFLSMSIG